MGCSSSQAASAPATSANDASKPQGPVTAGPADGKPPASAEPLELDGIVLTDMDEGPRSSSSLASLPRVVPRSGGRLGEEAARLPAKGETSTPVAAQAAPEQQTEASTTVDSARVSGSSPTSRSLIEDLPLSASPFGSVPHEKLAKSSLFWRDMPAQEFNVRSAGYKEHKRKEPSSDALYNCVAVDVLKGAKGLANLLQHERARDFTWWRDAGEGDWDSTWGVPRILIVNCLLPIHSPIGFKQKPPGCTLVGYFRLSSAARQSLASGQPGPQMKLWQRLCKIGKSTREGTSFKAIGQLPASSLNELPNILQTYNGKPVLVTESATFVKDLLPEILEVDVDVGKWAFLARQTLYSYQGVLSKHAFHAGYLVEGKTDEELPETMLGCFCISGADLAAAMDLDGL